MNRENIKNESLDVKNYVDTLKSFEDYLQGKALNFGFFKDTKFVIFIFSYKRSNFTELLQLKEIYQCMKLKSKIAVAK